jgi:hypothetical protein
MMIRNTRTLIVGTTANNLETAVHVDLPPNIDMECLGQTSKTCNDPQEDISTRKSNRLKRLPTNYYLDFDVK